jgi:putative sigma-54 modulation protein
MGEEPAEAPENEFMPRVDGVKSFVAEPMTLEQAIKEMEELDHEFFPFHNDENGRINIVYKKDRGYGLIDPRLA